MIPTSATAELRFEGTRVGKAQNIQLTISRDAVETTALGEWDRNFISGIRNTSATATVLYDPADTATAALFNSILTNSSSVSGFTLVFDTTGTKTLVMTAVITQVSPSVSFGEAVACSVSMQVSGKPTGTF